MRILSVILLAGFCASAWAQTHHDPLNEREVDALRETAQVPQKRIELLIEYSRERVLAIERLRSSTKPGLDDSTRISDLLADLAAIVDELDDNLTMYGGHSEDLRRPLRHVIAAEADFQHRLAILNDNATPLQKRHFAAALEDATESLKSSTESAQTLLADQIEKKGEEKNKEKLDQQDAKQAQHLQMPDASQQQPPDYTGMGGAGRTPPQH